MSYADGTPDVEHMSDAEYDDMIAGHWQATHESCDCCDAHLCFAGRTCPCDGEPGVRVTGKTTMATCTDEVACAKREAGK